MIPVTQYKGDKVAVLGLARSGLAAARALREGGAEIIAWDDQPKYREGFSLGHLSDPNEIPWNELSALILSPGIPFTHPVPHPAVEAAREASVPVIGDMELFAHVERAKETTIVGITGTNGKSTTAALVNHMLDVLGRPVALGGNIGTPVLDLDPLPEGGVYVLELSSYQIDLARHLAVDVAVLLNISPDHLERHGGLDNYVAVKRHLFEAQDRDQMAIIGMDDPYSAEIRSSLSGEGRENIIPISVESKVPGGVFVLGGSLIDDMSEESRPVGPLHAARHLPGRHNLQNIAAAYAVGRLLGYESTPLFEAICSFTGLPHRMETVGKKGAIHFINDSKATNVEATARALACYENIYWIAGGRSKGEKLAPLASLLPAVRKAYMIGEATDEFASECEAHIPVMRAGNLKTALHQAYEDAQKKGHAEAVILLSPAAASFDQFTNFEERGDVFRKLVEGLT